MMITLSVETGGRVPVTVLHLVGELDSTTYTDAIKKAQEAYDGGARNLLIDLEKTPYVSSAGLMALHTIALIFAGQSVNSAGGRPTFRALDPKRDELARLHVKLLKPQPAVLQVLETIGLTKIFESFTDLNQAFQAF
ncbi:MAG: STAS domain-containing protein [Anaerolineales bacterium]|nr:STAS domain-containing protein [Anaerolineales bacterium]